ncbi:TlpA disulfide reductase family protein [uncultured Tenacibaculum sp.]|uniref:TlpA family protein disulfide reductase n=1 Tax=uncultured Tenacibaculum sp. TaxID=174713 RepID=UPI00261F0C39|nr:TlpA disulfide reductase family protein [uncultured Tenacibaculum sp.]
MKKNILSICMMILFISCNSKEKEIKENSTKNQVEHKSQKVKKVTSGDKLKYLETLLANNPDFNTADLKGKSIYIDNWATWCAPCLKSNKSFIEKYDAIQNLKDIVFVFVSFDFKENTWRNYIEKKFPKSNNIVHLYSGFKMDNDYSNYFGINELPNYFSVDKEGFILSLEAPSANDENFIYYLKTI